MWTDSWDIKKTSHDYLDLVVMEEPRTSIRRAGYFASFAFIFLAVVSLIRAVMFPGSFTTPTLPISTTDGTIHSLILSIDTTLLAFLVSVLFGLTMTYKQPREVQKGWGSLSAGAGVVSFFTWLSMMDGIFRIFIYIVFLCCSLYAFFAFRRYLKKTALTKP